MQIISFSLQILIPKISLYTLVSKRILETVFGWSRKEQLYCFVRQRGPQWAKALKTVSRPDIRRAVRSLLVRGLAGPAFLQSKYPLTPGGFVMTFPLRRSLWNEGCFIKQLKIFPLLVVLVLQRSSKIVLCISPEGKPAPPQCRTQLPPCLCIPAPLWLWTVWTVLWTQGRSWRLNEACFLQIRNGGHRKAFVPMSPQGPPAQLQYLDCKLLLPFSFRLLECAKLS